MAEDGGAGVGVGGVGVGGVGVGDLATASVRRLMNAGTINEKRILVNVSLILGARSLPFLLLLSFGRSEEERLGLGHAGRMDSKNVLGS